ncbi:restriction endonuclease subunit S [Microbacterium sp. No. 7]|uniref:restriction endonuclease subunit S n=1 Tax=Microbacterium sp. No. 7 TaxID=1714373 RepID=UPI0030087D12
MLSGVRGGVLARGIAPTVRGDWRVERSSELFELKYGKALVESIRAPGDVPVFGTNGQAGTHNLALFKGPGVIIGRKGAGHLGVHWSDRDYWVIDTAYSLVPSKRMDLKYSYYLIKYVGLNHLKHGTSNPSLTRDAFGAQYFPVPSLLEQRAIAAMFGAVDDKIESNRRAADTLVALIGALFEQVISSHEVVYAPLGELARTVNGRSYKSSELQESSTALVTLKSVDRNGGYKESGLKPYTGPHKPEQEVRPGEIVVAQTDLTQGAEVVGRGVRVPRSGRYDTLVASLDLAIVRPLAGMPVEYLHGLLSSEAFRQHCRAHVTGTTVLHLAKDAMPTWSAPIVHPDEQERFAERVRPMLARMDALSDESARLVALRDALLPEVLSGRVRVPIEGVVP